MNSSKPIIIRSAESEFVAASHEDRQNPSVYKRVILHKEDVAAGRLQMLNWAKLAAGRAFRQHYHEDMDEIFVIVQGSARMTVDGESFDLSKGDAIVVTQQQVHSMIANGSGEVEFIVFGISSERGGKTITVTTQ